MIINENYWEFLTTLKAKSNLTYKDLAILNGKKSQYIHGVVTGKRRNVSFEFVMRLKKILEDNQN